ncbi:hypothetical protein [Frigoribacterium sp. RIT-PI-h]|uniref:hypothetical protein n=1 Tax=Frigoribacterium sp. RIT-PI-h TaxID=1690245 RepID=UPI0006B8EFC4|nr:hypothetical protein [Frigoribacterium sp. RIT-PI-h]KPG84214.1 hypothetical protein AEQ27_07605 [Frigoribacterium sp. RIT-PI-h]
MSVDARHPSCFEFEARLYVVPSWSGHGVAETRRSLGPEIQETDRGGASPGRWAALGALVGGSFLGGVAATVWRVDGPWAPALIFVARGALGAALAVGARTIFREGEAGPAAEVSAPRPPGGRRPAGEVPWDVARAAPEDSTGDELVLWSTLTSRYREAREALVAGGGEDDRFTDPGEAGARIAEWETAYRTASRDYEPVARLLGFTLP